MINASRYAITSFSIEMRSIQVDIAPWRAYLTYRPQQHPLQPIQIRDNLQRVKAYSTYGAKLGMKDKMSGTNALIDNKVFR